jgi:hypothetical protein
LITIKQRNGLAFTINDEDYGYVSRYTWHLYRPSTKEKRGSLDGLIRYIDRKNIQRIEAFLFRIPNKTLKRENKQFKHVDGDIFNCCRDNIILIDRNVQFQSCERKRKSSSGYQGVYPQNKGKGNGYTAKISFNHKRIYLGYYATPEEAARAYNKAALKYFGPNAKLNVVKS